MSDVVSEYCQFVIEYLVEFIVVGGHTVYDSYSFLFLEHNLLSIYFMVLLINIL